jgi:hypothetical protein
MLNAVILAIFIAVYILWPELIGDPQSGCFAISTLVTAIIKGMDKGPDPLPPPPPYVPPPTPPAEKPIEAPSAAPTEDKASSNAFKAEEKRRILGSAPKKTKDTYAGDTSGTATVKKKTLLGGGTTGSETTGA